MWMLSTIAATFLMSRAELIPGRELAAKLNKLDSPDFSNVEGVYKEYQQLERRVASFPSRQGNLEPNAAAEEWIGLLNKSLTLKGYSDNSLPEKLVGLLPRPEAWPRLSELLRKHFGSRTTPRAVGLCVLAELLSGTPQTQKAALAKLAPIGKGSGSLYLNSTLTSLKQALAARNGDNATALRLMLELADAGTSYVYVDDRVWDAAAPNQESLIKNLLMKSKTPVMFGLIDPKRNSEVSRWALETAPKHRVAQWGLVHQVDQASLYKAIAARFSPFSKDSTRVNSSGLAARSLYILGLADRGAKKEAFQGAGDGSSLMFDPARLEGLGVKNVAAVREFVRELALAHPSKKLLSYYSQLARGEEVNSQFDTDVRSLRGKKGISVQVKSEADQLYIKSLMRRDELEKAATELKRFAGSIKKADQPTQQFIESTATILATQLGKPQLLSLVKSTKDLERISSGYPKSDLLIKQKKFPEAQAAALTEFAALQQRGDWGRDQLIVTLIKIYEASGRYADLVTFAQAVEWSNAESFLGTYGDFFYQGRPMDSSPDSPLRFGEFCLKAGRLDLAAIIAKHSLRSEVADDGAYSLLTRAEKASSIPFLEKLAETFPYEERPVIWKAKVLFEAGKLDEALATIQSAIDIDPSDGETGPGKRMYGYSVFADILEAKGDKEKAEFFRGAVKAIRLSERADALLRDGLETRALRKYEAALELFSGAYCIQSRLAVRLAEAGKMDEAKEHYRAAYELMSSSFGYVESHCFGCEHVFEGETQQALAEEIFQRQLDTNPARPQNHYLLGYLREEQGRIPEAISSYRTAIELAPKYLNAILRLANLLKPAPENRAELESLASAIAKLQPATKMSYNSDTQDYAELYRQVDKIYSLFGSTGTIAEALGFKSRSPEDRYFYTSYVNYVLAPGAAIAQTRTFQARGSFIQAGAYARGTTFLDYSSR